MFIANQLPYPIAAFPPRIADAAYELANSVQVTGVIAGTSCLTTLSVALSGLVDWRHPLSGQIRPCVLYQAIAAKTGDRKSAAELTLCAPIYDHDLATIASAEEQKNGFARAYARWKAIHRRTLAKYANLVLNGESDKAEEMLAAIEAQRPIPPLEHRIIYSDVTMRAMFEALEGDGRSMALLTDEGQTLLDGTVMFHYGALNNMWDGKPLMGQDRAEGEHLLARNPRLTISFMIQPEILAGHFAKRGKKVKDSGFCARFLFSRSASIQGHRPPKLHKPLEHIPLFHGRLRELLEVYRQRQASGLMHRDVLEFDEQAQCKWLEIAERVEADFLPGNYLNDISDFGNKYMDIVGRIACLLHYYGIDPNSLPEDPNARSTAIGRISADTLLRAAEIASWHLNEYKQLFSQPLPPTPEEMDADRVYSYLYRSFHQRGIGAAWKNHVRQYGGVRNSNRLRCALQILVGRRAICVNTVIEEGKKKPSEVIALKWEYFNAFPVH